MTYFSLSPLDRKTLESWSFPSHVCSFWKVSGYHLVAKYFLNEPTRKPQFTQDWLWKDIGSFHVRPFSFRNVAEPRHWNASLFPALARASGWLVVSELLLTKLVQEKEMDPFKLTGRAWNWERSRMSSASPILNYCVEPGV